MPKRLLSPEVINEIVYLAETDELHALKIAPTASGANEGRTYAEYTKSPRTLSDADIGIIRLISEKVHADPSIERMTFDVHIDKESGKLFYQIKERSL